MIIIRNCFLQATNEQFRIKTRKMSNRTNSLYEGMRKRGLVSSVTDDAVRLRKRYFLMKEITKNFSKRIIGYSDPRGPYGAGYQKALEIARQQQEEEDAPNVVSMVKYNEEIF